jgi:hypothetical protein
MDVIFNLKSGQAAEPGGGMKVFNIGKADTVIRVVTPPASSWRRIGRMLRNRRRIGRMLRNRVAAKIEVV